ncbi:efflux transporter periplasmic adaptor subunit [Acuticoccus sp. M5D2P5]|uniref:efflux RND transporter periplasmic adaptor subunit n=1 Tax=Acuticoccus kalidii TaxID=2910977 RepID=UPI001F1F0379|nr:HlyD family efflux transporter periplasmic adaptor subunit [Acuticoccus kalidii]MCF3933928.1 efflux transporter periplasmic adaptor subunit [Acuticoccus kalidii]
MTRALRIGAQAVLPALVLFGAFLATERLVSTSPYQGGLPPQGEETVYPVTASDAAVDTNRATLRAFGTIVAAESAELRVASPGEVVDVHDRLKVGETVEKGAALVTIDPFAYEGALREARAQLAEAVAGREEAAARIAMETSALERAEEQLELATRDLSRARQLVSSGNITEKGVDDRRLLVSQANQTLDQRRYTLKAEEARLDQQIAAVERLESAVESAERALRDTVLTAPFTAIIRDESAAIGQLLGANDVAVSLIGADAVDVRFVLSDQRYGRLLAGGSLIGAPVSVTWRIGDIPLDYEAHITRVGADIASDTGGVDVFARLVTPEGRPVPRPGAFVEVTVPGPVHPGSVRLPATALYGDVVYVITEAARLKAVPVRLLALDDGEVILSGAVETGDAVVTTRLAEVGEGIKVRRVGPPPSPSLADLTPPPPTSLSPAAPVEEAPQRRPRRQETTRERS